MSDERDRQHEHLEKLLDDWECTAMPQPELSAFLLDNGVTVELPPAVEVKPGTTGTGVVKARAGAPGERRPGIWGIDPDDGRLTFYAALADGLIELYSRNQVTDFVPDPEPLTAEDVERVVGELGFAAPASVRMARKVLAPYVAKAALDVCLVPECGGPRDCSVHPHGVDAYGGPR